jgi:hypothetical protein
LPQHLLSQLNSLVHTAYVHTALQAVLECAKTPASCIDLALQHNLQEAEKAAEVLPGKQAAADLNREHESDQHRLWRAAAALMRIHLCWYGLDPLL